MARGRSGVRLTWRWGHALPRRLRWGITCLAALAVGAPSVARAQGGVIAGVVVAEGTQQPIQSAQIGVQGTQLGTTTDGQGRFRLTGVPGTTAELTVRRIGYRPVDQSVRVGTTDVRITMSTQAVSLEQVVVTGTAGVAERRAIGNAVSTVNVAEVTATQPVRSFQDLVTGRAAGVSVVGSSGQVGTGSRIRVRGASSLSLANDPLIYVDGIRVDNAQATGPINQAFGSRSISRWNDFNPDDIESIEIIKGPAAATLYGTEASNGVIQIITKRGAAGRPSWNFTARVGANYIPDVENALYTNYGVVPDGAGGLDTVTITTAQLNDSVRANFGHDIFRTGVLQDYQLSVSGGTPALRYYVGGNLEQNEGVEYDNSLRRAGLRANLSIAPNERWDVSSSMAYTTGRTYIPLESGGGGATWATYFASPSFLYDAETDEPGNPQLGFRSGPPEIYNRVLNIFQDADRFTGSVTVNHRPASWFNHRLVVGVDRAVEDNQEQAPRNDVLGLGYPSFSYVGPDGRGYVDVWTRNSTNTTFDYVANASFELGPAWRSVTSVGGQYYGRRVHSRNLYGEGFPAAGLTAVVAAEIQQFGEDEVLENNTVGGFIQEQLVWNDRLFLTAALRTDDNSAFGTNFNAVTYPKFSASWVVSEEPFFDVPDLLSTLRLRAAYGASGLQPGAFDAIRTYEPTGGQVTPLSPGNPDLGPERSTELELGFDAGLFDERLGIEVTYFNGTTKDAILSRLAPPSEGFRGLQFFNAGQVDRSGLEWVLTGQPLSTANVALDLTLSGSTNDYTIASLGDGTERVSLSSQVQHVVGYAPGAWWDRRVVSADKVVAADGSVDIENMMCDNGQGGTVACSGAPRVFLGNSVPTYEGSFTAGLTLFRNWRLNAFFDWRGGYKKLDGNRRVRCNLFSLCEENYYPSRDKFDAVMLAEVQGGTAFTYNLIQDASFTRFRELSLTYTLPERLFAPIGASRASITVAGRNLALWTSYPGLEPEASFNGGTRGGAFGQWEQNVLPQTRQIVTTINVSF